MVHHRRKKLVEISKSDASIINKSLGFFVWFTGIVVFLIVALGMISGVLANPWIPNPALKIFGWIIIVTTVFSIILEITKQFE
jgi:uncharacterized membrane protein YfcA